MAYCNGCGSQIDKNELKCPICGQRNSLFNAMESNQNRRKGDDHDCFETEYDPDSKYNYSREKYGMPTTEDKEQAGTDFAPSNENDNEKPKDFAESFVDAIIESLDKYNQQNKYAKKSKFNQKDITKQIDTKSLKGAIKWIVIAALLSGLGTFISFASDVLN